MSLLLTTLSQTKKLIADIDNVLFYMNLYLMSGVASPESRKSFKISESIINNARITFMGLLDVLSNEPNLIDSREMINFFCKIQDTRIVINNIKIELSKENCKAFNVN